MRSHVRPLLTWGVVIFSLGILGAGCGNSGTSPSPAAQTSPATQAGGQTACDLLTADIAQKALGGEVKKSDHPEMDQTGPDGTHVTFCSYARVGGKGVQNVSLLLRIAGSTEDPEMVYTNAKASSKALAGVDPIDVQKLGDHAYWSGGNTAQLNVFTGHDWLIISAFGSNLDRQAIANSIAPLILANVK